MSVKVKVKFICIAHFMYKAIQSALHKIKALQQSSDNVIYFPFAEVTDCIFSRKIS